MALINSLDPGKVADQLGAWLMNTLPGVSDISFTDVYIPSSNGMSSESVLMEAEWTVDGARVKQGLVARVAPTSGGLFPDYDLEREATVMNAIATGTAASAPKVVAVDTTGDVLGAPFLLMERAYGEVPSDDPPYTVSGWVMDLDDAQRATLYDNALAALAQIGQGDVKALGLEFLVDPALGESPTDRLLAYWRNFYSWAGNGRTSPTIDAAWEWLEVNRPAVESAPAVCWGDARLGNLMFGPEQEVTGVFDWELAQVGPHEFDLGFLLFTTRTWSQGLGVPLPGGFPDPATAVRRYEELSGLKVQSIDWWEAFAGVRCAILLLRVGNLLIELGALPQDAALPLANPASVALAQVLGLPAPSQQAAWITGSR
ncbi:phosphotransferase family protein [Nocardioides sp. WS12]|uniref:phosphotransferase family protein n=1 Tax=Nocardioides sp. WS12 TaxID=2486272 RepID=UPI0015F9DC48|nr:phosphotransferase family protein [Nocardioides sp. WS12]